MVRRSLTAARVVAAAIAIVDESGSLDTLTLKAVAARLGVRVPSLYNHVDNLDDLRQRMALAALEGLGQALMAAIDGKVGQEALLAGAHAIRRYAGRHPASYLLTVRAPDPADRALQTLGSQIVQSQLLILASLGLEGDDALHALRAFRSGVHGFVALEQAGGFGLPLDRDASFEQLLDIFLRGLRSRP